MVLLLFCLSDFFDCKRSFCLLRSGWCSGFVSGPAPTPGGSSTPESAATLPPTGTPQVYPAPDIVVMPTATPAITAAPQQEEENNTSDEPPAAAATSAPAAETATQRPAAATPRPTTKATLKDPTAAQAEATPMPTLEPTATPEPTQKPTPDPEQVQRQEQAAQTSSKLPLYVAVGIAVVCAGIVAAVLISRQLQNTQAQTRKQKDEKSAYHRKKGGK